MNLPLQYCPALSSLNLLEKFDSIDEFWVQSVTTIKGYGFYAYADLPSYLHRMLSTTTISLRLQKMLLHYAPPYYNTQIAILCLLFKKN